MRGKTTAAASLAVIAALLWWWQSDGDALSDAAPVTVDDGVDFTIKQLSVDGVDAAGRRYRINAQQLLSYRDARGADLHRPRVAFYRDGDIVHRTTADAGNISGDVLSLRIADTTATDTTADAAVRITADEAEVDLNAGRRVYSGNVTVRQRGLTINAERLTMRYSGDELSTATATGAPATFRQRAANATATDAVHGASRSIAFNNTARTVTLNGDAIIIRGGDETRGDTIVYHLERGTMNVRGASATVQP